jgi:hypothetical protein
MFFKIINPKDEKSFQICYHIAVLIFKMDANLRNHTQSRITGGFLSSQSTRYCAERYTTKTTAAALAG